MATSIPTFSAPTPSILRLKITSFFPPRIQPHIQTIPFRNSPKFQCLNRIQAQNFPGVSWKTNGFWFERKLRVRASAKNEGVDSAEEESRGESTMPERFRYLTKEAPDPPVRWPWLVALVFLIYAWRAVLLELANWRKAAVGVIHRNNIVCHSGIVAYAPIPELTTVIILASTVLAIAEAVVPNAVNCQPFLLTASGVVGYAAVAGYISEPFFWTILVGFYSYSRLVKKRDDVTSALPAAAVMSAIGEPWVRVLVIASYLALAIFHRSKKVSDTEEEIVVANRKLPKRSHLVRRQVPSPMSGLAIGIRLAAEWAGYRHLTWMIV
ncbi:hypothetical protein ACFX2A_024476 [Malus domestica]